MSRRDARKADALKPIRTYDAPPKDFDPSTATAAALRRYGFPRRPDPVKEPTLARLWKQAFERPITFVKAELAPDPIMSSRPRRRRRKGADFVLQPAEWAGIVQAQVNLPFNPLRGQVPGHSNPSVGSPASDVFGRWIVPEVFPADLAWPKPLIVGFWVGLDGIERPDGDPDSGLLQAGIAATVAPSGVSYLASPSRRSIRILSDSPCALSRVRRQRHESPNRGQA